MDLFWLLLLLVNGTTTVYHVWRKDTLWAAIASFALGVAFIMLLLSLFVGG